MLRQSLFLCHCQCSGQCCKQPCSCVTAGAVSEWPAIQLWKGQAGLQHLAQLAGAAQIQAMITADKEGLFFGNMRQFTPYNCSFQEFLSAASDTQNSPMGQDTASPVLTRNTEMQRSLIGQKAASAVLSQNRKPQEIQGSANAGDDLHGLHSYQAYLAQASLDAGAPLELLRRDFTTPQMLSHVDVTATNLWMSIRYGHFTLCSETHNTRIAVGSAVQHAHGQERHFYLILPLSRAIKVVKIQ